jgi:predicted deacylase
MSAQLRRGRIEGPGVQIPVVELDSERPGPLVVISANLHGDECTGIGAIHRLLSSSPGAIQCGRIRCYPSLNPSGLMSGSRGYPGDAMDPNRAFPGSPVGTAAQRHAHRIWTDILRAAPQAVIDLHTDSGSAIPYAIIDRVIRGSEPVQVTEKCQAMAEASGLTVLQEYPKERYRRFDLDRSLPGALVNGPGIPAVTLEIGPRRRIDAHAVDCCVTAVEGILGSLGVLKKPSCSHQSRACTNGWRRENGPRTGRVGVLVPLQSPGSFFERGDILAEIRSLEGDCLERLRARVAGFVVALPELGHVSIGTPCATIAVRDGTTLT